MESGDKPLRHEQVEPAICGRCKNVYYCPVHDNTISWIEKLDNRLWFIMAGVFISAASNIGKFIETLASVVVRLIDPSIH